MNDLFWSKYDLIHKYCPICGNDKFTVSMLSRSMERDTNICCCHKCLWEGIVDNLVDRNERPDLGGVGYSGPF